MMRTKRRDKVSKLAVILLLILFVVCISIGITLTQISNSEVEADPVSAEQIVELVDTQEKTELEIKD